MNWSAMAAVIAAVCAVATLLSAWVAVSVRAALAELRVEMANMRNDIGVARGRDMAEMRQWINGSFMRTPVVEAEMKAFEIRLDHIEKDNA
jgi:hypothetical protein